MFMGWYHMNKLIKCLPLVKNPDRKWWEIWKHRYVWLDNWGSNE